jgi:hypothetical protein
MGATETVWGHNPDSSFTRIQVTDRALDLEFLFDVQSLAKLDDLDGDHDGRVTLTELERCVPDFDKFLRTHITLFIDAQPADFGEAGKVIWTARGAFVTPGDYHQTLVSFPFHRRLSGMPRSVGLELSVFTALGERHANLASVDRGTNHVDEVVLSMAVRDYTCNLAEQPARAPHLLEFLMFGMKHIFLGYDHILFLLALMMVSRFKELVKIVTAFTLAHTITLTLAALQIASLPPRLIETGIAATIMYVAIENLWIKSARHRWMLTFGFGLIHGFGFANVLRDLGLPNVGLARALLCFNLGVEAGQLAILAALFPLTLWLARQRWSFSPKVVLSLAIFALGFLWFVERAFALKFMPI